MEFARELKRAISATDLSLEQLSELLAQRGASVSVSSLSAWQTGVSRPEQPRSLQALAHLEGILGLEGESLRAHLDVRQTRGRRREAKRLLSAEQWQRSDAVERLFKSLDASPDDPDDPVRISQRTLAVIDSAGHHQSLTNISLLRAGAAGATRYLSVIRYPDLTHVPRVLQTSGLKVGRFRADRGTGYAVVELLLDPPLPPNGLRLVEITSQLPRTAEQYVSSRAQVGSRDLVIDVRFDPERLPATCTAIYRATVDNPVEQLTSGVMGTASYQLALVDPTPGIYRVRWTWPD